MCKLCIGPSKRSPQDTWDGFDLYIPQASSAWPRFDLVRPLRLIADFRPFWTISFDFVKVCWISFSSWKSFIGFYILSYPLSTILTCSFTVGVRISWEWLSWKGSMAVEMPSLVFYLVNYPENSFEHLERQEIAAE